MVRSSRTRVAAVVLSATLGLGALGALPAAAAAPAHAKPAAAAKASPASKSAAKPLAAAQKPSAKQAAAKKAAAKKAAAKKAAAKQRAAARRAAARARFVLQGSAASVAPQARTIVVSVTAGNRSELRATDVTVSVPTNARIIRDDEAVAFDALLPGDIVTVRGSNLTGTFVAQQVVARPSVPEPSDSPETPDEPALQG